jgi:hypothetical protein
MAMVDSTSSCSSSSGQQKLQSNVANTPYILIGSEHSLYTGKLRAYMIWRGLPFIELTASAELYRQVVLPRTGEWRARGPKGVDAGSRCSMRWGDVRKEGET